MKHLYESLLSNVSKQASDDIVLKEKIRDWCQKAFLPIPKCAVVNDNNIVDVDTTIFKYDYDQSVILSLSHSDGEVPDYIKWGNTKNADLAMFFDDKIKSFKNFPTELYRLCITSEKVPQSFISMPKNINYNELEINNSVSMRHGLKSLKGLTGHINKLSIYSYTMDTLDSGNKLSVDKLIINLTRHCAFKNLNGLPKCKSLDISGIGGHGYTSRQLITLLKNTSELAPYVDKLGEEKIKFLWENAHYVTLF